MPNWVCIDLYARAKNEPEMKRFREAIRPINREIDCSDVISFDRLIPQPEAIRKTSAGFKPDIGYDAFYGDPATILTYEWVKSAGVTNRKELQDYLDQRDPEFRREADQCRQAELETGSRNWYDWSIQNWGTKWDASMQEILDDKDPLEFSFRFHTAWEFPEPIIIKLAEMFPELQFTGDMLEESSMFEGEFESDFGSSSVDISFYPVSMDDDEALDEDGENVEEGSLPESNAIAFNSVSQWF